MNNTSSHLPVEAIVVARTQESHNIFTLTLQCSNPALQGDFPFAPGQFNMLYLPGIGQVAISILENPQDTHFFRHTIRNVGRVTQGLSQLKVGDQLGVRGPFGQGWPLATAKGRDILILTGGLGCAPSVSIIHEIEKNRANFGKVSIVQGVKHSGDMIFHAQYEKWAQLPNTQVLLAADTAAPNWPGHCGLITELLDQIHTDPFQMITMMCGPEAMMLAATDCLMRMGVSEDHMYLSLERNMACAIGHCGHCQFGGQFICKDGPVFCYPKVKGLLGKKGF